MSGLMGWLDENNDAPKLLEKMAGSGGLPHAPLQAHEDRDFAMAAYGAIHGSDCQRLAVSSDGTITVAFAGQLYDEDAARRQQPARICLKLYQRHGPAFAEHLNGTFVVAIHDRSGQELHLVTDRMASRAVYYTRASAPFAFGTEVKFLLEYPGISRKPNLRRLREFLTFEYVAGEATYYDHIRQVPAASVLTRSPQGTRITPYWRARFTNQKEEPVEQHARRIADALRNSMRRVCTGHERIGLMLSAGLDSRAVACASEAPLTCLTMSLYRGAEVKLAARVAGALGHPHQFIPIDPSFPLGLASVGSMLGDGMHGFHHSQGWLMGPAIGQHDFSLLLNGCGLDGFFSGKGMPQGNESGWRMALPPRLPDAGTIQTLDTLIRRFQTAPDSWLNGILAGCTVADVQQDARETLSEVLAAQAECAGSPLDLMVWLPLSNISKLRSILNVSSYWRMTDEGIPLYDNEIMAAFLALPAEYRFQARAYGRALSLLNAEVARIPRSWTCLPIPCSRAGEIVHHYRSWCGILAAEARTRAHAYRRHDRTAWPRLRVAMIQCPEWHSYLRRRVSESRLVDAGVLDGDNMRRLVEDQIVGRRKASYLICAWLTLEEWLGKYG